MPQINAKPIAAVIFDHDGTLVNSEPVHLDCWRQILLRYNADVSSSEYAVHLSGIPSIESARWLVRTRQLPIHAEDLYRQKHENLLAFLQHSAFPLMPGATSLLTLLQQARMTTALASGAKRIEVHRSVSFHNLHSHFPTIVTSDDTQSNKPAPDIYLQAAERLGLAPEDCLAIEDSDSGELSARAAGMRCLRLRTPSQLPDDHSRIWVQDLPAVAEWLAPYLPQVASG